MFFFTGDASRSMPFTGDSIYRLFMTYGNFARQTAMALSTRDGACAYILK